MKRLLLVVALGLATVGCAGDDPVTPLTTSEYSAQGNAFCDQMNAELDALSVKASSGVSPEVERDIFVQAGEVSRQAIDALFDLEAPAALLDERQALLELMQEQRTLIERLNNGADLVDEITDVNQRFDAEAMAIWPSCTT